MNEWLGKCISFKVDSSHCPKASIQGHWKDLGDASFSSTYKTIKIQKNKMKNCRDRQGLLGSDHGTGSLAGVIRDVAFGRSLTTVPQSHFPNQILFSSYFLLEKEMATHSSTLAWKIPWMEQPARL